MTTALGTLHLSVVYDASVADLLQSLPVHITTPMRSSAEHKWSHDGERLGSQSAMSVSPQSNSVANKMMMMDVDETDSTTEPTRSEWNDATPPRPSGSRSPFPSPTMVNNMRSFLSEKGKKMSQTASGLREGLALHLNTQKKLDTNVTSSPIQTHSFHPRSSLSESFTAGTSASNESSPQWMSDNELASLKEEDDLVLHSGATKPMSIPISPQRSPRGSLGLEDDLAFPPPREDAQDTTRMRKNLGLNISTHSSHQGDGLDLMAASFSPHRLLSPSPFSSELFGSFVGSYEVSSFIFELFTEILINHERKSNQSYLDACRRSHLSPFTFWPTLESSGLENARPL